MKINCVQNGVELPAYVLPCMSFREPAVIFNKFLIFLFGDRTVLQPVSVRYGWADFPAVNLFNKEGIPASPFRTDDWGFSK